MRVVVVVSSFVDLIPHLFIVLGFLLYSGYWGSFLDTDVRLKLCVCGAFADHLRLEWLSVHCLCIV